MKIVLLLFILGVAGGLAWIYVGRKWDGESRFTVIRLGRQVVVESFDPVTLEGVKLALPDQLEIESVDGRGKWLAGAISRAGSRKWVADSVADYLGITYTSTSLGWWDRLGWWRYSREVRWKEIALDETSWVEKGKTADGLEVWRLNQRWEMAARELFYDSVIAREGLVVVVVNTTDVSGLGAHAARVLESSGIKVGMVESKNEEIGRCVVRSEKGDKSRASVKMMMREFGCEWKEGEKIVLELGREYLEGLF